MRFAAGGAESPMSDHEIEIAALRGEIELLKTEVRLLRDDEEARIHGDEHRHWWAEEMLFWRTKYLLDHPDQATKEYVRNARQIERIDVKVFL